MMKKEDHKEEKSMVLIETLWNVNKTGKTRLYRKKYVLIETLWNVNTSIKEIVLRFKLVLIETLWNVNEILAIWQAA